MGRQEVVANPKLGWYAGHVWAGKLRRKAQGPGHGMMHWLRQNVSPVQGQRSHPTREEHTRLLSYMPTHPRGPNTRKGDCEGLGVTCIRCMRLPHWPTWSRSLGLRSTQDRSRCVRDAASGCSSRTPHCGAAKAVLGGRLRIQAPALHQRAAHEDAWPGMPRGRRGHGHGHGGGPTCDL